MLAEDTDRLLQAEQDRERLILLGAHDPYLGIRDRTVVLADKSLHQEVWKYIGNPGAILRGGRIIGVWKTKTENDKLELSMRIWQPAEQQELKYLAEEYAAFRLCSVKRCTIETEA